MPLKIIICGGGIGGLTAAGYLRSHRHHVTVVERGQLDSSGEFDYGLGVISNAFNLLLKAGIRMENLNGVLMTHTWVRSERNDDIRTKHFDTRSSLGAPSVLTRRAELQKELLRFAIGNEFPGNPAEIVPGAKVSGVDVDAGKVWTEDGRVFEGDLIIGADGINSVVRSAVLGQENGPPVACTHDLLMFMTSISVEQLRKQTGFSYLTDPLSQAGLASFMVNGNMQAKNRILVYNVSPRDVQVIGYTSEKEFAEKFDSARTTIIKDVPVKRVVDEFAPYFCESLVNLFRHNRIDAWRIRDIPSLDTWFRGRAVLIGDAAHAVTPHAGQGCNITIEDAEALAYLLSDAEPGDHMQPILQKFMGLRKDRAEFVRRRSREMGNILSEEERKLAPIGIEWFGREIHGYQGVEQALKMERSLT